MPRGDRTGPAGMGPMTGRAAGFCAGYGTPGFAGQGYGLGRGRGLGRGFGRGFGRGQGMGMGYGAANAYPQYAQPQQITPAQEVEMLKRDAQEMRASLAAIDKRVEELSKD